MLDVLVDQLNNAGQFPASLAASGACGGSRKDPGGQGPVGPPLLGGGAALDVINLLDSLNASDASSPAELLGLKALSMIQLDQKPQAKQIEAALASRAK